MIHGPYFDGEGRRFFKVFNEGTDSLSHAFDCFVFYPRKECLEIKAKDREDFLRITWEEWGLLVSSLKVYEDMGVEKIGLKKSLAKELYEYLGGMLGG